MNSKMNDPAQNPLRKFFNTPKGYALATMFVLMLIAMTHRADDKGMQSAVVAVVTALVLDLVIRLMQRRRRLFSDGGVVTGLIVALVLSSTSPWYVVAISTAIGIVSKHVLKVKKKPIFNPAAFGLLVAIPLFATGQSWWGDLAALPMWCTVFVIVGGFLVAQRVNKFPQVFAFIGVYFSLFLILGLLKTGDAADALRNPIVNSALFMAFFMLTDPPTSPGRYKDQVWFGGIAAAVSVAIYALFGGLSYLLIGLLVANVWKVWSNRVTDSTHHPLKPVTYPSEG